MLGTLEPFLNCGIPSTSWVKSRTKFCSLCLLNGCLWSTHSVSVASTPDQDNHSYPGLMYFNWSPFLQFWLLQSAVPRMYPQHQSDYVALLQHFPVTFRAIAFLDLNANDLKKPLQSCLSLYFLFLQSFLYILQSSLNFSVFYHVILHHASKPSHIFIFLVDTFLIPIINLADLYTHPMTIFTHMHTQTSTQMPFSMKKFPCSELLQQPPLSLIQDFQC